MRREDGKSDEIKSTVWLPGTKHVQPWWRVLSQSQTAGDALSKAVIAVNETRLLTLSSGPSLTKRGNLVLDVEAWGCACPDERLGAANQGASESYGVWPWT